jgi:hypothetical protein
MSAFLLCHEAFLLCYELSRLGLDKKQMSEQTGSLRPEGEGAESSGPFAAKFPEVNLGKRAELAANTTR